MPPKARGGGSGPRRRNQSVGDGPRRTTSTPIVSASQGTRLATSANQSKFNVAPLILEGVKLNKLQLNDLVKQHMSDIKLCDIQLSRTGTFTLYALDVKSFNRLLNDLPATLTANNHPTAKIFVPRSIQRIQDTEKVAFVKRVDVEIPEDRITEALVANGLKVTNVTRLTSRDGNASTRTVKVTLADAANRNTFVLTGLQVDSMHFPAEAANQNTKPVQCFMCMKYNHVAKYCKTQQQVCARCGENHRLDQCSVSNDATKCCNCNGNHLATSIECSKYREQEKKAQSLVNQYASARTPAPRAPAIHSATEFPSLLNPLHLQQANMQKDFFDEIISMLSSKMEKLFEETTNRLFQSMQEKIEKLEKAICAPSSIVSNAATIPTASNLPTTSKLPTTPNQPTLSKTPDPSKSPTKPNLPTTTKPPTKNNPPNTNKPAKAQNKPQTVVTEVSDPDSSMEEDKVRKHIRQQQELRASTAQEKQDPATAAKRPYSPNSSLETATGNNKDQKTNT
jgi:hypothetical protein